MKPPFLFLLLCTLSASSGLFAQPNIPPAFPIVTDTISTLTLPDSSWQWMADESGQATITTVQQLPLTAQFRSFTPESRQQNDIVRTFWVRFRLKNTLNRPIQVALRFPGALRTDLYVFEPRGRTRYLKSGLLVPWSQRDGYRKQMQYGNDFVLITLPVRDEVLIYRKTNAGYTGVKASHIGVRLFSAQFVTNTLEKNSEKVYSEVIGLAFHLGVMVWVALLNLLFFSIVRERVYVYFAFYVLFLGLAGFDYNQHLFHLFFRELPQLYYLISPLYFGFIPFFLVLFIQHLFQVGTYFPRWNRVLSTSNVTAICIWFIYSWGIKIFATPQWTYYAYSLPGESSVLIYYMLLITVVLYIKSPQQVSRNRAVVLLLFYGTWIVFWSTLQNLQHSNRLFNTPLPAFHTSLLVVWPTIEMIYLYALVLYFNWILLQRFSELRKQVLQKELEKEVERNQLMAQQNETLEQQVTLRTAQLEQKNWELVVEAALERVRSRSLAMQKSDELREIVRIVVEQMLELGLQVASANIVLFKEHTKDVVIWTKTNTDHLYPNGFYLPYNDDPTVAHFFDALERREPLFTKSYTVDEKNAFWQNFFERSDFKDVPAERKKFILDAEYYSLSLACQKNTGIILTRYIQEPFSEKDNNILKRFVNVFEQAYTRFLDLQKAEINEHEAVRQASLDRVRAEIASMRTPDDLQRITPLIWRELTTLHVPFLRCGVFIMDAEAETVHTYLSTPNGQAIASFKLPYDTPGLTTDVVAHWHRRQIFVDHWDEAQFLAWGQSLASQGLVQSSESYVSGSPPKELSLHFVPFQQGMLYVGNTTPLSQEALQLVQALAEAFATAYARYQDFTRLEEAKQQVERAFSELKTTQTQLIQKEKMASLGELTAGIAHEIQNPLNFVNNFAEVSVEMADELQENLQKGDVTNAAELSTELRENMNFIVENGKRAAGIVRSMLEHSRSSTGERRPTNLNELADEYLKLAFHGMRAKDPDFQVQLCTQFDEGLRPVTVAPQDMGRVLLNLYNNAFYAVQQKQKQRNGRASTVYEPQVTVSIRADQGRISLLVKDNGTGIPAAIIDKIYQPFFTTKPTGQGTGLGLSLSYDIITKGHGGNMRVESHEGEGTEFIISLPLS